MSFRNRCRIAGAEGTIDLSIPLEKGRDQKSLIREVRISGARNWQADHWKTLLSCYSRSPWFEFYRDDLEKLYRRPAVFLTDWNLACFEWSIHILGLPLKISFTEAFQKAYPDGEWEDRRGTLLPGAQRRQTGNNSGDAPGHPGKYDGGVTYHQVFEERTGFLPGLSILDLLFCEGKKARSLLTGVHTADGGGSC